MKYRVLRGGSYRAVAAYLRPSFRRRRREPVDRRRGYGFRIVVRRRKR
jgi:formylglycine-generating enzyme required for sulfatase activity